MTNPTRADAFHNALESPRSFANDELLLFANQLRTAAANPVERDQRQAMWAKVIASQPRPALPTTPAAKRTIFACGSRRNRIVGHLLPAPAVLFFGILVAVILAFSGLGNGGSDMVTPTVTAQQAATAISSPITIDPTSAIDQLQD